MDADNLDEAREDVRQGQEQERRGALHTHNHLHPFAGVLGQGHEVVVGELAALGAPGRSRGVDDRGDIAATDLAAPCLQRLISDLAPGRLELVEPTSVYLPHLTNLGHVGL